VSFVITSSSFSTKGAGLPDSSARTASGRAPPSAKAGSPAEGGASEASTAKEMGAGVKPGPSETTRSTAEKVGAVERAAGLWLST
jgi:hypothetical protein